MANVKVSLGQRSYRIQIESGLLQYAGKLCAKTGLSGLCAIISDANVEPLYATALLKSLENAGFVANLVTLPAGEKAKDLKVINEIYDKLAEFRLERKSFVVALGGGVVGDAAGFVAATYLRGIPFVQIPTTLLAQVDSSVGGKVGVNLKAGKNLVGSFHQPKLVLCDLDTLKTLPDREFKAGLAEVIKYGIIYDAKFFRWLEKEMPRILLREPKLLARIVARCCEIKAEVVGQDETETGLRAILNFGHTIGHAIEAISGYGKYLHGEAISIGQVLEARISQRLLGLRVEEVNRIEKLFAAAGLPIAIKLAAQKDKLFAAMAVDKKSSGGEVKFVLPEKIGKVRYGQKVPRDEIENAIAS